MPFITIDTNAEAKATKTELSELVELVSAELNKPKDYIAAKINTGKLMSCGANPETVGALIEMKSIEWNCCKLCHIVHKRRNVRFKGLWRVHTPPQPLTAHTAAHRANGAGN